MTTHQLTRTTIVRPLLCVAFLIVILLSSTNQAQAEGTFIPALGRVDMVYDSQRDLLYITRSNSILRYHVGSGSFLEAFHTTGRLGGIDISPDGNTLVVADQRSSTTSVWVHVIDLQTEQITQLEFPRAFGEDGTYTVAFANDGTVLSTSRFAGSGWVPLRRFNPITGAWTELAQVRHNSMVTASGNMGIIGIAEADSSDGPFGRYRIADGDLLSKEFSEGTGWFNFEIGVNSNGTQFAIPTFNGTYIADENLNLFRLFRDPNAGNLPIGVVYHPVEPIVYFALEGTTEVRALETFSFSQIASYDFEHTFSWTGNFAFVEGRLRTSRDGSLLFATVENGVRYLRLYDPLTANPQSITADEDTQTSITLTGSVGNGAEISYVVTSQPSHGTLSGVAPNLIYTPDADYNGPDSFTFKTVYGAASSEATVSITINPVNDAPTATPDAPTTARNTTATILVLANDSDPDGDVLTVTAVTQGANGTTTITNAGTSVSYRPRNGFTGTDSFTYTISDGNGGTATATVTVNVIKK